MARQIGYIQAWAEYAPVAVCCKLLARLPLRWSLALGERAGALVARLDLMNRKIAHKNLEIAFPDRSVTERSSILHSMYRNWGRMLAEWCHLHELTRANIERFAVYEGVENWRRADEISDGRGVVIVTAHFGNFELMAAAHAIFGYPVVIVGRPLRNPLIDRAVNATRERFGNTVVSRKGAGRVLLKHLRANRMVVIPADLDVRNGVFVDFFGLKASTTPAPARLALATGAALVPAFIVREDSLPRHRIVIFPPIELCRNQDREEAVREATQRIAWVFEEIIRHHPDHWNWIHRRWKTRPPGESRFY